MTVYLLHFERPVSHAGHYLGFTDRAVDERLQEHVSGRGSPLVLAAAQLGYVRVVRVWDGAGRETERQMKNRSQLAEYCPTCRAAFLARKAAWMAARRRA